MKKYLNIKLILLFTILGVGLSSCDDEDDIADRLVYSEWETEDLGRRAENGEDLFSVFTFDYDGRGAETLYYISDGEFYRQDLFKWEYFFDYDDYMVLTYRDGKEFYDAVIFPRNGMKAIHYLSHNDFYNHIGGARVYFEEFPRSGRY